MEIFQSYVVVEMWASLDSFVWGLSLQVAKQWCQHKMKLNESEYFVTRNIWYFELGILSFNSYVYHLANCFISLNRVFNLLTCVFNLPNHAFNLTTCAFSLVNRATELLIRGFELLTLAFELVTCGFELVICGS